MTPLIDTETLAEMLNDPRTVVLDASWYMPAENRDPEADFETAHIPGARRFDFDGKVKDQTNPLPHMMPPAEEFQSAARELGISRNSRVILYDGAGIFAAPRAWWMFKAMGHGDVAVLNGGLPAWRAAGRAVESGSAVPVEPGDFTAKPDPARIRDANDVLAALVGSEAIVDARGAARFEGSQPEPRAGLRSGHMPGARNLPFDKLLAEGHYRAPEEIRAAWAEAGLPESGTVIASCGSGVTASVIALGAEAAGLGPVAVYDGSWSEWGQESRDDLPVVQGPA